MSEKEKKPLQEDFEARERTTADVKEPPAGWKQILAAFGPSFVLAGATVGSGEIIATPILGAKVGLVMLWAIIASCLIKLPVQEQFGRYAVYSGKSLLTILDELPGPRLRASWAVWWVLFLMTFLLIIMAGIVGVVGLALRGLFGVGSANLWGLIAGVVGLALIFRGLYTDLQRVRLVMVVAFSAITVLLAFIVLPFTPYAPSGQDLLRGLALHFPKEGWAVALAVFGMTGITANEMITYTYWVLGKGYSAWSGPVGSPNWLHRARGWIRVMHWDLVCAAIVYTITTVAFYVLGAAVLAKLGTIPAGFKVVDQLAAMYTKTVGEWARVLFMIAAFAILYSTYIVNTAGFGRAFPDVLARLRLIKLDTPEAYLFWRRFFTVASAACMFVLYYLVPRPTVLIITGGMILGLSLPLAALVALLLDSKLRREQVDLAQPSWLRALLWVASLGIWVFTIWGYATGAIK
ncbi:MAG: Nramp family divalent metal transporter [Bacillota bacterium]